MAKEGVTERNSTKIAGDLQTPTVANLVGLDTSITQSFLARLNGALNKRSNESFELRTIQLLIDVHWTRGVSCDERKIDFGLRGRRQFNLGLLGGFTNTLDCHSVILEINARFRFELFEKWDANST